MLYRGECFFAVVSFAAGQSSNMALQSFSSAAARNGPRLAPTRRLTRAHASAFSGSLQLYPQPPVDFAQHMLALEAILPTMSCSQLAKTGTSVRETYRAALLSTEAATDSSIDTVTRDLLDFFTSQLPNQSWLLTYRSAVEKHLMPQQEQDAADSKLQSAQASSDTPSSASNRNIGSSSNALGAAGLECSPEHLAEILATIAALPIQVVQPLPIGFGTPRWSRPMAAADPAAWEQWLANMTTVYADLLAQQLLQQQQDTPDGQQLPAADTEQLMQQLTDFTICLACSMRWVNVNVDDDRLQTADFRQRVLQCLQEQQQQQQEASLHKQQQRQPTVQQDGQQEQAAADLLLQAQQQQQEVPFALAGSLAHRVTYTCLLLLLPPPRPMLSAFFNATNPADFTLHQLQSIVRGMLFVGCAPPEPWLKGLVQLVRARVGEMGQKDLLSFVEAFRFFGTQVGRAPWLRDVTALMEEFSCAA